MTTKSKLPAVAIALMLTAICAGAAHAGVTKPGNPAKGLGFAGPLHGPGSSHNPIIAHGPLHGPGSSHNPIIAHGPLHGPGSSHNPIVVVKNCNDPNTLCRRP